MSCYCVMIDDINIICNIHPALVKIDIDTSNACPLKIGSVYNIPTFSLLQEDDYSQGVRITSGGGDSCPGMSGATYTAVFNLQCDTTSGSATSIQQVSIDSSGCVYTININSRYACPSYKTMPAFPLFVVCMVILIMCYCVIGIVFKSISLGTSGWESVPHIDFWRSVFRRLDGCINRGGITFPQSKSLVENDYHNMPYSKAGLFYLLRKCISLFQ